MSVQYNFDPLTFYCNEYMVKPIFWKTLFSTLLAHCPVLWCIFQYVSGTHLASPCSCEQWRGPCDATCAAPPAFSPPCLDWVPKGSLYGTSFHFCSPPSRSTCSGRGCDAQSSSTHQEPSENREGWIAWEDGKERADAISWQVRSFHATRRNAISTHDYACYVCVS